MVANSSDTKIVIKSFDEAIHIKPQQTKIGMQ